MSFPASSQLIALETTFVLEVGPTVLGDIFVGGVVHDVEVVGGKRFVVDDMGDVYAGQSVVGFDVRYKLTGCE